MRLPRASGVLLHPTSLPGPFGVGDLGPEAHAFAGRLAETGQKWWQILPIGPTGYGNSPYQSYSSFAGNPLLISPEWLEREGLLEGRDFADYPAVDNARVDFDVVIPAKERLLRRAFTRFPKNSAEFAEFRDVHRKWLDDYVLFMALKESNEGKAWYDWPAELVSRQEDALALARTKLAESIRYTEFVQYIFDRQWEELRAACVEKGVALLGDLPIFVAQDSADVWSRPELFQLDEKGRPTVVAGVPPDYFAATGQLWGNPLYRWEAHEAEGFRWWIERLKSQTDRVDLVRLDHFRGFQAYWEIPAGAENAIGGRWALGPGTAFLDAIRKGLDGLPIVAEDLGDITKEVESLRDHFELPGMRVIQFGLGGEPGTDFHLPYRYVNHCVAYSGTHDNDTTIGWFNDLPEAEPARELAIAKREFARRYLGGDGSALHWDVIRAIHASVADTVIVPVQDLLGLDSGGRMNVPGIAAGNWGWRLAPGQFDDETAEALARITADNGRWSGENPRGYGPPQVEPALEAESVGTQAPTASDIPFGL